MRSFKRRRFARAALSLFAVLGLITTVFSAFAPEPARADHSQIYAVVRLCDEDLSGLDFYSGLASCPTLAEGWPVTLSDGAAVNLLQNTVGGSAHFTGLNVGVAYALWPSFLPPYAAAHAACSASDASGTEVVPSHAMAVSPTGVVNIGFQEDGHQILCDFLLYTPATPTTSGTVTVNKSTCPDGFDGYSASRNELAANCGDASTVASFTLTDVNGDTQSATTPGSAINEAVFSGVPTGAFSLTEDPIDGYGMPRVFCQNRGVSSPDDPSVEVTVTGTTADYELKAGYEDAFCQWYNIAYDPGFVAIVVNKYACPEGYFSSDPSQLAAECNEPYDPITFKLDGASTGNPGDQETGSVIPNGVRWGGLEGDTYYIHEFLPEEYGEPIVFCKLISNDDLSESPLEQVPVEPRDDGVRIVRDVADFYTLSCDWYNTSGAAYSGIYLHKYGCPADWDESWDLEDWIQACTTVVRDATFIYQGPGGVTDEQPVNGIDVWWELLPPGQYRVSEEQPSAWSGSVVYCSVSEYNQDPEPYERLDLGGNASTWDLGPNGFLDCYWFNLPAQRTTIDPNAPATLTIVKYTCPEAYDPLALEADPEEDCDEPTDGIAFSLIGSQNASLDGETGDDSEGTVTFNDLRAGSYLLRETYPESTEQAFIGSCESDARIFDYPFTPFARIDATGAIMVSLVGGETLECSWYDVPSPDEDGEVEVTIRVVQCGPGAVNLASCDEAIDEGFGVSLTQASGDGEPIDFETDENGVATGSVDAGEYEIDADEAICLGNSDAFTADNTLEFTEGEDVEIVVGLCA